MCAKKQQHRVTEQSNTFFPRFFFKKSSRQQMFADAEQRTFKIQTSGPEKHAEKKVIVFSTRHSKVLHPCICSKKNSDLSLDHGGKTVFFAKNNRKRAQGNLR